MRPTWKTTCLKTLTSEHPCQREGPFPWGQVHRYAFEAGGVKLCLHPDKRRHGACLERFPQTATTAPLVPLSFQDATIEQVNDTHTCSVRYSHHKSKHFDILHDFCFKKVELTLSHTICVLKQVTAKLVSKVFCVKSQGFAK